MKIVQVLNTFYRGDAIGNHALAIRDLLVSSGYESEIYTESEFNEDSKDGIKYILPIPDFREEDILLYHFSINVKIKDELIKLKCRKIAIYHNVTPYEYFIDYSPASFYLSRDAVMDLKCLAYTFDYCIADSSFNRDGLIGYGYKCPIDVLPIIIPYDEYKQEPDKSVVDKYNDGRTNIIFVGRVAPNKKQEDIIAAFSCYKKNYDPDARLIIVGSSLNMDAYKSRLDDFIDINKVEDVIFTGKIPFGELLAYYKTADIFLCMSEHEGFCVPLIEAMFFDVPVVAYASSAVPETLGGAGILLSNKDPLYTAGIINKLVFDKTLKDTVIKEQRRRLEELSYENLSKRFMELISGFQGRQT